MRYYSRKVRKYSPGDIVFSENSPCDGMYILDKGRVRVYKTVGSGANARQVELCTLGPKAMFGEMAMIDESRRSASVQAVEPSECTIITKQIFEDQLSRIPTWMVNMIRILVKRLRDTNEKLREHIENKTMPGPQEDSDGILMVNAEREAARSRAQAAERSGTDDSDRKDGGRIKPEEIIEDLFQDKKSR